MEARVGIERFMLCFPSKFSHQTADSQGYSATTRLNPILLVHYSATEEITEGLGGLSALFAQAFGQRTKDLLAEWRPYLEDVAFQAHVLQLALPWRLDSHLPHAREQSRRLHAQQFRCPVRALDLPIGLLKNHQEVLAFTTFQFGFR